jgi:HNH endonuclease
MFRNSPKLALRAGSWYNGAVKLLWFRDVVAPLNRVTNLSRKQRSVTMNTLPPHADNGNIPEKRCTACFAFFPATPDYFGREKGGKYGVKSRCKVCESEIQKTYYAEHPEALERKRTRGRKWQKERRHHPETREGVLAYDKDYRDRPNVHEQRQNNWKSWCSYPEIRQSRSEYAKNRRDLPEVKQQRRGFQANREARKRSISGTHTPKQVQAQLERQKFRCYYAACGYAKFEKRATGSYIYHVDHTFPISRVAGSTIPANDIGYLVLACPTCNDSKGNKFPWEWIDGGKLL